MRWRVTAPSTSSTSIRSNGGRAARGEVSLPGSPDLDRGAELAGIAVYSPGCLIPDKLLSSSMGKPKVGVSVGEAARRLGMSREGVYAAIRERRLKARLRVIIRCAWRIGPRDLRAFWVSPSHQERGKEFVSLCALRGNSLRYMKLIPILPP
jgi:hypothetical protein